MKIDWSFLATFNGTAFKGWSGGWLWIGTGVVWGICAIIATLMGKSPPVEWLLAWLTGLGAYSGISYAQFKTMRETDWGAMDRKAIIEKAKAGVGPEATSGATGTYPVSAASSTTEGKP